MGLGDVSKSVTPKIGLIAAPQRGNSLAARYFMPWACHPSMAVTGSQCLAACLLVPGTVADGVAPRPTEAPAVVTIEHPMGEIVVTVDFETTDAGTEIRSAGLLRTARLLARGEVFIPSRVWSR